MARRRTTTSSLPQRSPTVAALAPARRRRTTKKDPKWISAGSVASGVGGVAIGTALAAVVTEYELLSPMASAAVVAGGGAVTAYAGYRMKSPVVTMGGLGLAGGGVALGVGSFVGERAEERNQRQLAERAAEQERLIEQRARELAPAPSDAQLVTSQDLDLAHERVDQLDALAEQARIELDALYAEAEASQRVD